MAISLLYFDVLSPLAGAPVLMNREPVPTARSAIKSSSVSPDLWLTDQSQPANLSLSRQ